MLAPDPREDPLHLEAVVLAIPRMSEDVSEELEGPAPFAPGGGDLRERDEGRQTDRERARLPERDEGASGVPDRFLRTSFGRRQVGEVPLEKAGKVGAPYGRARSSASS